MAAEAARDRLSLEQAVAVLDAYNRQIDAVARQVALLQALLAETARSRSSLEGLREAGESDVLIPLGAGTFVHARAEAKEKVLVGVGAGVTLEKTWAEAEKRLSGRETEIEAETKRLSEGLARLQDEAAALQAELEEAAGSARGA